MRLQWGSLTHKPRRAGAQGIEIIKKSWNVWAAQMKKTERGCFFCLQTQLKSLQFSRFGLKLNRSVTTILERRNTKKNKTHKHTSSTHTQYICRVEGTVRGKRAEFKSQDKLFIYKKSLIKGVTQTFTQYSFLDLTQYVWLSTTETCF